MIELTATQAFLASAAISAVGQITQGIAAQRTANFNAQLAEREAQQIRDVAGIEEQNQRDNLRRFLATQRAAAGGSGLSVSEGPVGLLAEEAASEGERDALLIRYSGSIQAAQRLSEAAAQRFQGKVAFTQGLLGAGASVLKGAAKASAVKKTPTKKKLGG